jgi:hypothetical protein
LGFDAQGTEVSQGTLEESNGAMLGFIGHDPGKGNAGSVIDGDVDVLPASALAEIPPVAGDAVAGALDPGELFNVEVDEFAWSLALIAADRRRRIEQGQTVQAVTTQQT